MRVAFDGHAGETVIASARPPRRWHCTIIAGARLDVAQPPMITEIEQMRG
jgi:hypothetical protein